jgi:hypothetical protein
LKRHHPHLKRNDSNSKQERSPQLLQTIRIDARSA